MNKLFLLLSFFLFPALLSAQEEAVSIKAPLGDVYGTLLLPESGSKVPVVLLIAGSGPTDRDGNNPMMKMNTLKMLAESLQKNGIASLRYDKRGIAASAKAGEKESDIRFEDYIDDVRTWIEFLKKDPRFDRIVIAGHSEGSLIGMIASQDNPAVGKFISIAGTGMPAGQILKRQLKAQPQPIQDLCFPIIDKLAQGDTVGKVSPLLSSLFRPSIQPYLISWFKYDPAVEIAKLKIPVLILQGTHDLQCNTEDANLLASAYPTAEKVLIPNMTHVLKDCDSMDQATQLSRVYSETDLPLNPTLTETIVRFVKK